MEEELDRRELWDAYIHIVGVPDIRLLLCATEEQKQRAFVVVSNKV